MYKTENLKRFAADTGNIAFSMIKGYERKMPGVLSSNIGKPDIPETYGDLTVRRVIFLPLFHEMMEIYLNGISMAGTLVYTLGVPEMTGDRSRTLGRELLDIRNRMFEILGFTGKNVEDLFCVD